MEIDTDYARLGDGALRRLRRVLGQARRLREPAAAGPFYVTIEGTRVGATPGRIDGGLERALAVAD